MNRKILAVCSLVISICMLFTACASRNAKSASMDMSAPAAQAEAFYEETPMMMDGMSYEYAVTEGAVYDTESGAGNSASAPKPGDVDVRKIIYNANMSITADNPEAALTALCDKAVALGGYVSSSYTTNDDFGARYANATLKVPSGALDALVNAAGAQGRVDDYNLSSSDISQSYYDIKARLDSAKAEEQALLSILTDCETVEDVLAVRESLLRVRTDIESYQGQINLWDNLVAYATLDLSINRTARPAVAEKNELIELWKASDVWENMRDGFINSARFVVNAIGAIGIFIAIAIIPCGILFLAVGLPIILHKKKKKRLAEEAKLKEETTGKPEESDKTVQKNE